MLYLKRRIIGSDINNSVTAYDENHIIMDLWQMLVTKFLFDTNSYSQNIHPRSLMALISFNIYFIVSDSIGYGKLFRIFYF